MENSIEKSQPDRQLMKFSTAYEQWITVELGKLAILTGEQVSAERLLLTIAEIREFPQSALDKAFSFLRKNARRFPSPAEIREAAIKADPLALVKFEHFQ